MENIKVEICDSSSCIPAYFASYPIGESASQAARATYLLKPGMIRVPLTDNRVSAIDHELIHACNDFKAQKTAVSSQKYWNIRNRIADRNWACSNRAMDDLLDFYMAHGDSNYSVTSLLKCFSDLANKAKSSDSPLKKCGNLCIREYIEEAITISQEIKWSVLKPGITEDAVFPPWNCFSSRSENHPAGADVMDCAIRNDNELSSKLLERFSCGSSL